MAEEDVGRRKRVLIVDDDEGILFVLGTALQALERICRVFAADSGDEAIKQIRESPFDLVITDLLIPGMTGQDLTAAIRQLNPETVVIWITAHRSRETDEKARQLAVYHCLDKPVGVAQIREIVSEALGIAALPGGRPMPTENGTRSPLPDSLSSLSTAPRPVWDDSLRRRTR